MRFLILLTSLLLLACSDIVRSSDDQELYYNYLLLKAYFYHPERVEKYQAYEGMEVDDMYESLKDYFCGARNTENCEARYTFYTLPKEADQTISQIENTARYYSFGFERIIIQKEDSPDTLLVSTVYPISPANSAGLKKGDKLLFANDVPLTGENAARYLRTDSLFDDITAFKVLRGEEIEDLDTAKKAEVQTPTVFLDSLMGVPFISVTGYKVRSNNPNGTYYEFKNVLQEIKSTKTAIMDLRGNPGGNIGHCSAMAAELVPFNSELVYDEEHYYDSQRGNVIDSVHYFASDYLSSEGEGVGIKWILLMNRYSASCAERFAAAVKYNRPDETVIIGEASYGKGIGQMYTKTYLGGLAYITCIQSFYPNGETFHNIGILPDVYTPPGDANAIYNAALAAAQDFDSRVLAKRLSAPLMPEELPPRHKAEEVGGAYKFRLFHKWE
ncbi:MAG: hypothetical protein LBQ76_00625 [Candidatus Fibromonas sp.]|jgi:C-terminal processing protease CtpA/Prc|nr:hypothetical protein [Candidatus Fibromonas sp.]